MRSRSFLSVTAAALTLIVGIWCTNVANAQPPMSDEAMKDALINALNEGGDALTDLIESDPRFITDPEGLLDQVKELLEEIASENPNLVGDCDLAIASLQALAGLPPGLLNQTRANTVANHIALNNCDCAGAAAAAAGAIPALSPYATSIAGILEGCGEDGLQNDNSTPNDSEPNIDPNESPSEMFDD